MSSVAEPRVAVRRRAPTRALGALARQVIQALGSFLVQLWAARELGASGFGTFAFLFGAMIMATALTTGLIGDSLTVLDRHDPGVRAALWRLARVVGGLAGIVAFVATLWWSDLAVTTCALFALAVMTFVAVDLVRRLLMANLRFWNLVVVDSALIVVSLGFLGVASLGGHLGIGHFLGAMTLGQLTACVVGLLLLPAHERSLPMEAWGDVKAVLRFGSWRAAQQFVRPTMLNAARWVVLLSAGAAAVGELEAARVFVGPAMLFVQGVGSYLFASYAADRALGTRALLARADKAAATLLVGSVLIGLALAAVVPVLGDVLSAGRYDLSVVAVLGWATYAASCAAVMPYGSLAAIVGMQHKVFALRVVDSMLSLALGASVVLVASVGFEWMPWLISLGSFAGGLLCRQLLLKPTVDQRTVDQRTVDQPIVEQPWSDR